ncbi:MAG TPA: ABC transporter permease [Candidatus Limnocylindria bacterium]|jgi:peptide/nickel transport system permease protein|nr:ABC transporter permease [Candidatus Limnocylindria bacterium]
MRNFLIRRLIQSAILLLVLMSFTFALTRLTPGGPEAALAEAPNVQPAELERIRERFGLNDPLPVAYVKWVTNALRLDFGRSYHYLRPPFDVISERIWPTIQLALVAYAIALVGILLGVVAAYNRGKMPDLLIRVFTVVADATPNWWVGLVIIVFLASTVGWFPQGQGRGGAWEWFQHIIVPAAILGLGGVIVYTRFVRSQVLEVLSQDHVRTARAKGLQETFVARWHVLRNALIPVVTLFGSFLPFLISGAAITESIFNWPGMGRLFLEAATTRDYPLLLAILTLGTVATMAGTLLADILYGTADPRIRYS